MQAYVNEFSSKSSDDGMQLKEYKCKKLLIGFSAAKTEFTPIIINNKKSKWSWSIVQNFSV